MIFNLTSTLIALIVIDLIATLAVVVAFRPTRVIPILVLGLPVQTLVLGILMANGPSSLIGIAAAWKEIAVVSAIVAALVTVRYRVKWIAADWAVACYAALVTIYLVAPNLLLVGPELAARLFGYRQAMVPVLLYVLGRTVTTSAPVRRMLTVLLIAGGVGVAVVAIGERIVAPDQWWVKSGVIEYIGTASDDSDASPRKYFYSYSFGRPVRRAVAPYASPLTLAYGLILPFGAVVASLMSSQPVMRRPGLWIAGALIGLAIVLSLTRAVIVGVVVGSVLGPVLLRRWRGALRVGVVIMLVAVSLTTELRVAIREARTRSDPSTRVHEAALREDIAIARQHPWGVGLGEGGFVGRTQGSSAAGGESLYGVIAAQQGLVTLALFAGVIALLLGAALRVGRTTRAGPDQDLAVTAVIGTVAFAVASLTTEHWLAFQSAALYWILIGVVVRQSATECAQATCSGSASKFTLEHA